MELTTSDLLQICCACSSTQGIFNVGCYGAEGDGLTDDLGAILAARDAVNAAGGGVLFFPRGSFVVSDTIELGASTTVLGLGARSVLEAKPGVACFNMLFARNSDNVRIRDLVLDGNRAKTSDPDPDNENIGCGFLGLPVGEGQTGLSIRKCHNSQSPPIGHPDQRPAQQ
jgi:Pectate lyase superfamily protein